MSSHVSTASIVALVTSVGCGCVALFLSRATEKQRAQAATISGLHAYQPSQIAQTLDDSGYIYGIVEGKIATKPDRFLQSDSAPSIPCCVKQTENYAVHQCWRLEQQEYQRDSKTIVEKEWVSYNEDIYISQSREGGSNPLFLIDRNQNLSKLFPSSSSSSSSSTSSNDNRPPAYSEDPEADLPPSYDQIHHDSNIQPVVVIDSCWRPTAISSLLSTHGTTFRPVPVAVSVIEAAVDLVQPHTDKTIGTKSVEKVVPVDAAVVAVGYMYKDHDSVYISDTPPLSVAASSPAVIQYGNARSLVEFENGKVELYRFCRKVMAVGAGILGLFGAAKAFVDLKH